MSQKSKKMARILDPRAERSIAFADLRNALLREGFQERIRGSHHVFQRPDVVEIVNLQRDGAMAKPYQVRQVRGLLIRYGRKDSRDGGTGS